MNFVFNENKCLEPIKIFLSETSIKKTKAANYFTECIIINFNTHLLPL